MKGDLRYLLYAEDALRRGDVTWFVRLLREGAPIPPSTMAWLADVLDQDVITDVALKVVFRPGPRPDPDRAQHVYRLGEEIHDRAASGVKLESVLAQMEAEGHGARSTLLAALNEYRAIRDESEN